MWSERSGIIPSKMNYLHKTFPLRAQENMWKRKTEIFEKLLEVADIKETIFQAAVPT